MTDAALILDNLERLADRGVDPSGAVYAQLFSRYPEFEPLFALDRDGGVRGSMLQQALDCLIQHLEGGHVAASVMLAERGTHEGYGVPAARFESFFEVIRDTFAGLLGPDWSDAHHSAWTRTIEHLRQSVV
ncbi:MAG: globin [Hyphomonas sp.]